MSWARLGLLGLFAVLAGCGGRAAPRDEIRFSHGPHIATGMNCPRCHGATARSDGGAAAHPGATSRPLLPAQADCVSCHNDPVRDRCQRCHTEPDRAETYTPREHTVLFNHGNHEELVKGRCVRCHGSDGQTIATFQPGMPTMATCTGSCHADRMRALDCASCHVDLNNYRIEQVSLVDHGAGFLRRHGTTAMADQTLCAQCHDPTFCEDCHQSAQGMPLEVLNPTQQYRDFMHRGDFLSRHSTEAGLERGTCLRCHGSTFCNGCHQASGVGGGVAPGSPHGAGWLDPLSPNGHARAARRDLISCVACHESDAETTCVPCHRVGGVAGGNPHPPGFGAGVDPLVQGVCRACHVP
jgi:hypothetical protein